jgi:hypothetical protein
MNRYEEIQALARAFSARLRKELTPEQMDEVVARNDAEPNPNVCHSHDFCDANETMREAMRDANVDPTDDDLWDKAWNEAKLYGFDFC